MKLNYFKTLFPFQLSVVLLVVMWMQQKSFIQPMSH